MKCLIVNADGAERIPSHDVATDAAGSTVNSFAKYLGTDRSINGPNTMNAPTRVSLSVTAPLIRTRSILLTEDRRLKRSFDIRQLRFDIHSISHSPISVLSDEVQTT